jgi:hypothetical protein
LTIESFPIQQYYDDDDDHDDDDHDDDVYLRLQHGKGFHNLVYISYVKHVNPASKAYVMNTTIQSIHVTVPPDEGTDVELILTAVVIHITNLAEYGSFLPPLVVNTS